MARIRSIKPEFWSDDTVTECSLSARLLFIGMWNFADDAGNLDRSHKQIKTRVFPIDNINCEPLIQELLKHELVIEYAVNGQKYLHIPGFAKHQLINRPSKPVVPTFQESLRTHGTLTEPSVSAHDGGEGRDRKGEDGKGREGKRAHVGKPVDNSAVSEEGNGEPEKILSGQSAPPEEPSPRNGTARVLRTGAAAERRNGDFEEINDTVEKLIREWQIPVTELGRLAQMAHVSTNQVEESLRQLRDRGRLPAAGVAA